MSTHFKWYKSSEEEIVPFNARYSFPSQANKANKLTPRIPPKNGAVFTPGQVIRVEFPAQGYINPLNTTLEFDVTLYGYKSAGDQATRFQNGIASIFSRVRLLYGATPLEDMINYNCIVRMLSEWTSTNGQGTMDQTSIAEGWGGTSWGNDGQPAVNSPGMVNVRQKFIQGINVQGTETPLLLVGGIALGSVPQSTDVPAGLSGSGPFTTRRYQINFALGLFTQDKLIPTKFMASQLAIELTLEQAGECIISPTASRSGTTTADPTYGVGNVNLIPEILEFDASYDAAFIKGLQDGGVPIKFSTWHTYIFSSSSGANVQLQVQERSRSVKSLFAVQRRSQHSTDTDSHALFFDTSSDGSSGTLQSYQFRIGGRYFPAAPVQCSSAIGSAVGNGGAEAFLELQKSLNTVGDYRLSSSVNATRWGLVPSVNGVLAEFDYDTSLMGYQSTGDPILVATATTLNSFVGGLGSSAFCMSINLESSNGVEISGLNAEEQSDISLIANWKSAQVTGNSGVPSNLEVYSYYDAMIILRENNVLELIQ